MIHKHVRSKDRRLWSDAEKLFGQVTIAISEQRRYVRTGYTRGTWDKQVVAVTPDELVEICQAHGIVVPAKGGG